MDETAHIAHIVRDRDRDRFLADLFVGIEQRPHILALHAFNAEIVRIREAVTDPVLGEIRQEWWREAIQGEGEGGGHPVVAALRKTMAAFSLSPAPLLALIDARAFDLYNDPMPTLADFEGYAGETSSALFQLAALILNGGADARSADAAGHAGVAATLVELLLRLPTDLRRRQLFLPLDRLAAHGVDEEMVYAGRSTQALVAAMAELRGLAHDHLGKAKRAAGALPAAIRPAFLPLALVESDLRRLDRAGADPLRPLPEMPQWRRQWALWRGARRLGG